jgi:copper chaperone NosL
LKWFKVIEMKKKLSKIRRLLLLIAAAGLIVVLFTAIWRIELDAPQYPEGLNLTIHANGLRGNVDIINGLNHYIGMKTLHNEDFFEFTILPYCVVVFAIAFALVSIINKRRWLNILFILFVSFGIIAMIDFWKWEYNYGHNLNPNAAIVVPGMAYQPPLIGFKQLLNFGAYSIPDTGGWIFIGAGMLLLTCVLIEWKKNRVPGKNFATAPAITISLAVLLLSSCSAGPEPIVAGRDNCYLCKMAVTDARYGGELITKKGKIYKFDDIHCLVAFLKTQAIDESKLKDIYLVDYAGDHSLIKSGKSYLLQGAGIRGPMNGDVVAFKSIDSMKKLSGQLKGVSVSWEQLTK